VLNAAVAAYYYLRIVAVMYFRTPLATPKAEGGAGPLAAAVAAAVLVVAIGILPRPLAGESNRASPTRRAAQQLSIAVQGEERKGEERRSLDSPRFLH
jgi:NADH-quinone oxidoreductase subunit N